MSTTSILLKTVCAASLMLLARPEAKALDLLEDNFSGNSGGMPSGWTSLGLSSFPTNPFVESGGLLAVTDGANNGPQLAASSSFATYSDLTLSLDIGSFTGTSGSHPVAFVGLGSLAGYALVLRLNGLSQTLDAIIVSGGTPVGSYSFVGSPQFPTYGGGTLSLSIGFDSTGFTVTSPRDNYNSGHVLYTAAGYSAFDSISDFGPTTTAILGVDGGSGVPVGTLGTVTYDKVTVTTSAVPEPSTMGLLFGTLAGMAARRRPARRPITATA